MHSNLTTYTLPLSDEDKLFVRFCLKKGKIAEFVLQYYTKTPKGWRTVIRYDTSHGYAHKDVYAYSKRGKIRHEAMGDEFSSIFTAALEDIKTHWKELKENYMFQ